MATKRERLEKTLQKLARRDEVVASAIVSRDGLLMADGGGGKIPPELFAAVGAAILSNAESVASRLDGGVPERVIVESKHSKILTARAGPNALLVEIAKRGASLDSIVSEMDRAAETIGDML